MIKLTPEERKEEREEARIRQAEYDRRDDLNEERSFWKDVFFSTFGEGEKITEFNMSRSYDIADKALEEFKRRFQ